VLSAFTFGQRVYAVRKAAASRQPDATAATRQADATGASGSAAT
jgi:hypothetical protein